MYWFLILDLYFRVETIWVKIINSTPLHYFQVIVSGKILEEKNHFELTTHFILKSKVSYLDNWAHMWLGLKYLKAVPTIMKRINSGFFVCCLWDTHDTTSMLTHKIVCCYGQWLVGQGFPCYRLIPESWVKEDLTRASDGGMVELPVFCFCHCSLGMQAHERISPWETLVAALFLPHLVKQDIADVLVHQHILKRAVQCAGFPSTPRVTANKSYYWVPGGRKERCKCVWERVRVSLLSRR